MCMLFSATGANYPSQIESKFFFSIFNKQPKRADTYWFVHVDVIDEPYTMEYEVEMLESNLAYRIDFRLGFRIEPRVNLFLRKVIEDMVARGEVDITSRYESLNNTGYPVISDLWYLKNSFHLKTNYPSCRNW